MGRGDGDDERLEDAGLVAERPAAGTMRDSASGQAHGATGELHRFNQRPPLPSTLRRRTASLERTGAWHEGSGRE